MVINSVPRLISFPCSQMEMQAFRRVPCLSECISVGILHNILKGGRFKRRNIRMENIIAIPYQLHYFRSIQRSMDADILYLIGITSVSGNKYLIA